MSATVACETPFGLGAAIPLFSNNNVINLAGDEYTGACLDQTGQNANISLDPLFEDATNSNFRLLGGSLLIDAGDSTAIGLTAMDFDGIDRIIDGNLDLTPVVDIGAFEFNPSGVIVFEDQNFFVNESGSNFVISICRRGGSQGAASVNLIASDLTAVNGVNYSQVNTVVNFADGELGCKAVNFPIIDNSDLGDDVAFSVELSNSTGGVIIEVNNNKTIVINDDEVDVSISKTTTQQEVNAGENITYNIQVQNLKSISSPDTIVTDTLPSGLSLVSVTPSQGVCSGNTIITCNLGSIPANQIANISLVTRAETSGDVINSVSVVTANDLNPQNNSSSAAPVAINAFSAQDLTQLYPFTTFLYQVDGSGLFPLEVLPNTRTFNGVTTFPIKDPANDLTYYSSDANGVAEHATIFSDGASLVFSPPSKLLNAQPLIGDVVNSAGTVSITIPGSGVANLNYTSTYSVIGIEQVTVPHGTFESVKVTSTIEISGFVEGVLIQSIGNTTLWYVDGVGEVKSDSTVDGERPIVELINLSYPPKITSLSNGDVLSSGSVNVIWDANGTVVEDFAVRAGNTGVGSYNLAVPPFSGANATSQELTGLPTDGSAFTISLYAMQNNQWSVVDSMNVTAFTGPQPSDPEITTLTPINGTTLTGSSVTVDWDAMGTTVQNFAVRAGNTGVGSYNLAVPPFSGANATSQVLTGLPTDGSAFTISLYAMQNNQWSVVDSIEVTAANWISGVFPVSGNFVETNCQDPADNGTSFITGTYTSSAQDGGNYTGTLSIATVDGLALSTAGISATGTYTGTHTQTASSGNYTLDGVSSGVLVSRNQGTFNASLTGNAISTT